MSLTSHLFLTYLRNWKKLHQPLNRHFTKFREKFVSAYGNSNSIQSWFPGHMYRGTLQLQAKLATVDCVIEVHDARIPFSGRNPKFYSMLSAIRPHILVLNKCDLADMSYKDHIVRRLQRENIQNVVFTNCKETYGIKKIIPLTVDLIKNSELYNRGNRTSFVLMIIGIPNVGKSSLINRLRNHHLNKKSASAVGAVPGITKSVLEKIKVYDNPPIYLFDTPGIMQPNIESLDVSLKLALCRTLKDSLIGEELMADYLLYWLNKHKNFSYVDYFNLKEPTDDIRFLIIHMAKHLNKTKIIKNAEGTLVRVPAFIDCSMDFLRAFRTGKFGKVMLDMDIMQTS